MLILSRHLIQLAEILYLTDLRPLKSQGGILNGFLHAYQVLGILSKSIDAWRKKKEFCLGDPLSTYPFVMATEILPKLIYQAAAAGRIGYHPSCSNIRLTHLIC